MPSWPPMHPGGRRCSSLSYTRYARSSRLARRRLDTQRWRTYFLTNPNERRDVPSVLCARLITTVVPSRVGRRNGSYVTSWARPSRSS